MATVILTTIGTGGDFVPFLQLAMSLKQRGHRAVLLSNCAYESRARDAGIEFESLDDAAAFDQLIEDQVLLDRPSGAMDFFRRNVLPKVKPEYRLIEKYQAPQDTLIFSRSTPAIGATLASEKFKIPLVLFQLAPISVEMWSVIENLGKTFWKEQGRELRHEAGLNADAEPQPLISRHVALWPQWFAAPKPSWPQPLTCLNFIYDAHPAGALPAPVTSLLQQGIKPLIFYTSRGKVLGGFEPTFFKVALETCVGLNIPGIFVCHNPDWIPQPLPAHVVHSTYLPLDLVLPQAHALIHHGGIGTIGTALAAGVPQVIVAHGGDRPDNAARCAALGLCEVFTPQTFTTAALSAWIKNSSTAPMLLRAAEQAAAKMQALQTARPVEAFLDQLPSLFRAEVTVPVASAAPAAATSSGPATSAALADKIKNLTPAQRAALLAKLREKKS